MKTSGSRILHLCISIAFSMLFLHGVTLHAESLFLKNGTIIEGRIISETDRAVSVRLTDNSRTEVARRELIRTLYSDEYKSRSFIYRTDGTMIQGHIVDDTPDAYTVRPALTENRELTVLKKETAFIARQEIAVAEEKINSSMRAAVLQFRHSGGLPVENADIELPRIIIRYMKKTGRLQAPDEPVTFERMKRDRLELTGIQDNETIGKIGSKYGADIVVRGTIVQIKGGYLIEAKTIRSGTGVVLASISENISDISDLEERAEQMAYRLSGFSKDEFNYEKTKEGLMRPRHGVRAGIWAATEYINSPRPVWVDYFYHSYTWDFEGSYRMSFNDAGGFFSGLPIETGAILVYYPWMNFGLQLGYNYLYGSLYNPSRLSSFSNMHVVNYGLKIRGSDSFSFGINAGSVITGVYKRYSHDQGDDPESGGNPYERNDFNFEPNLSGFEINLEYFFSDNIGAKWVFGLQPIKTIFTGLQISYKL